MSNSMTWLNDIRDRLSAYMSPDAAEILVAAAIVVTGYCAAWLTRFIARKYFRRASASLVRSVQRFTGKPVLQPGPRVTRDESAAVALAAGIVFWLVFVLFISVAANFLGMTMVSKWFGALAGYLPRALAAAAAIVIGVFVGRFLGAVVATTTGSAGVRQSRVFGKITQGAVLVLSVFVAIDELGLEITSLIVVTSIVLGAALGSMALAFGLGARTTVANLVATHYLGKWFAVGQTVRVGDDTGRIVEILPTAVVLQCDKGRLHVPSKTFTEQASLLVVDGSPQ